MDKSINNILKTKKNHVIRHLLLTGPSGVGKTTVMTQLAHALTDNHPDGFFTREIRENGIRKGFDLVTLDERHGNMNRALTLTRTP
jgi:nucleoside-triphosphatase THEP1